MNTEPQSLRTVQLHGPAMPGGKPGESFWTITLGAPYFGSKLLQEDRTHPVRTLALDVMTTPKGNECWRKTRLLSQHVIGGYPEGPYSDNEDLLFQTRIGTAQDIHSRDGDVFYTGELGTPTEKRVNFQHVVATPMLGNDDLWPDAESEAIRLPPCRLVQGTIPLLAKPREEGAGGKGGSGKVPGGVFWLGKNNPLGLHIFNLGGDQRVRLGLAPNGIVLDGTAPFPLPDGTERWIKGRFLLAPAPGGKLELRLLPEQLTLNQQEAWSAAWAALAPNGDAAAENLPGFKVELRLGGLAPSFAFGVEVAGSVITGFKEGIRVPGKDVLVRMLGPAGAETREGEAPVQPETWVLTRAGSAGALADAALKEASHNIWKKDEAYWGNPGATVAAWKGVVVLTAVLLPPAPKPIEEAKSAPGSALRIDVPTENKLEVKLLGRAGNDAEHHLAHDETQLAIALRAVQGLPEFPPGQRDPERPLLGGFVPLSDGWLQIPVPNLPLPDPEKDSDLIAPPVPAPPNVLGGFLRYGEVERLPEVLSAFGPAGGGTPPKLQLTRAPWLVTVEGTQALAIAIALGGKQGPKQALAVLLGPELSTRGLLWFSADRPDALEALPRLGAGAGKYLDVPLESFDTEKQQVLPVTLRRLRFELERQTKGVPDVITRQELALDCRFNPSAKSWTRLFEQELEPEWEDALKNGRSLRVLNTAHHVLLGTDLPDLRKDDAIATLPLVLWLRHPAMPLAALMAMTRSASAAVRPLESRDLIPLVVDAPAQADGKPPLALTWSLANGSVFPTVGAGDGPKVVDAHDWPWPRNDVAGIALAAFGVPGTELRAPIAANAQTLAKFWAGLEFTLRFDLPALDEAFATASLPPVAEVRTADATDLPPPAIPLATALDWRAMGELWDFQSRRHHLARVRHSHLDDPTAMGGAKPHGVRDLVGNATWPVALGFEPGKNTDELPYGEATIGNEKMAGNAALLGVSGEVEVTWETALGAAKSKVELTGYAVPTIPDGKFLVDARGTGTGEIVDGTFWRRKVFARFREPDKNGKVVAKSSIFDLVTSPREFPVFAAAGQPQLFGFWFKDLPVGADAQNGFIPSDGVDSAVWEDGHLPRSGTEWRLWPVPPPTAAVPPERDPAEQLFERGRDRFPFFGFGLEPLRMRQCSIKADGTPGPVVIRCRLHLGPLRGNPDAGGNLVDLSLAWDAGTNGFLIDGLDPVDPQPWVVFALRCREPNGLLRRVEIETRPGWKSGSPVFSETVLKVELLGGESEFRNAAVNCPTSPNGLVKITWEGTKPRESLIPGEGKIGVEAIQIQTGTETLKPVQPSIEMTRWLALLPAAEEAGGPAAPPALFIRAATGQPMEFRAFGTVLPLANQPELREENGAISFAGKGADSLEPFPGYGNKGAFSFGLIARVSGFDSETGVGDLEAGYLSGRWVATASGSAPDHILVEAACLQRSANAALVKFWSGALTLHLRFRVNNAIRWPGLESPLAKIPYPGDASNGRETLTFSQAAWSGFSHKVEYVLDGHQLAFAKASRLAQETDAKTVFSVPVMATHTLTPEDVNGKPFTFTAVETIALGRARALIPEPADGERPAKGGDKRTFESDPLAFGARYRDILINGSDNDNIPAPGMVAPGQGRLSTVLSGALGHGFRAAFWAAKPTNRLALIGGFAGFIGNASDLAAPDSAAQLIRLPVLAVLGEKRLAVSQQEKNAEVAWADGTAALPIALAWRTATAPASATVGALRAALLGGIGPGIIEADVEAAILVEQSYRVNMDKPAIGDLAQTIFFPAAAVAVARLMPPHGTSPSDPAVLSLVAGVAVRNLMGKQKKAPFAAALLTRAAPPKPAAIAARGGQKAALGPEKARPLLATLGEQVVVSDWAGPPVGRGDASSAALVAQRAFAEHAEPRAALLVEIDEAGHAHHQRANLPAPPVRARFRKGPKQVGFADPLRGFGLPPGEKNSGWLRGLEEGPMTPFRDAEPPNTEPVEKSGLAGLSRRVSLPAQALPANAALPIWTAEAHAPIYHPLADVEKVASPPISWLAPGQPRPRLPAEPALEAAQQELFGDNRPPVQWMLPAATTAASVGDRAGISLARTLRLETPLAGFSEFDYLFARFGRPAQGGSWSVRTERTPRPGALPQNHDDSAFNRRPCASPLEPRLPLDVLRGPTDAISGEPHPAGKFGAWVVKFLAAPDWDGMISDRFDGTVPVDVEIDVAFPQGSEVLENTPAANMLLRLLMPEAGGKLSNIASLVVGETVISCQRLHFVEKVGQYFKLHLAATPDAPAVFRGTLRIVLDPRTDQAGAAMGSPLKQLADTLRAGFLAPPVELRLTVLPDSARNPIAAPVGPLILAQPDPAKPEIPYGDSRPPVTLRLPLMPVVRSRGALPLPPNSLIFMDSAYDADLGSAPAMDRQRIASVRPKPNPLPTDRGDLFATLYADRTRINRRASIAFMIDLAFEHPLGAAAQATANAAKVDGDFVREKSTGNFELALAVTTRDGVRRDLLFGVPGSASSATALPRVELAMVYELPFGLLLETDRTPARLAAGDMLELTVAESTKMVVRGNQSFLRLDPIQRVKPALWDASSLASIKLEGLTLVDEDVPDKDEPLSRTVRVLLTDEPVVEPPPALYAALTLRTSKGNPDTCQLSLPLYAQSPLPWRVLLRDAKADFRRGYVRRAATFIWNLARPAAELDTTGVHIVKTDRNGQTYLPPKEKIGDCFPKSRRILS
jgi:hypothetical protein